MKNYHSKPIDSEQARVVVVHCSDPRYQPHFQDFLQGGLGLKNYGLIAIPGGIELLSPSEINGVLRYQGLLWMSFMVSLMNAERCVLIAHGDCRWYIEQGIETSVHRLREHQTQDMEAVRKQIHLRFPFLALELYYAQIEGEHAAFELMNSSGSTSKRPTTKRTRTADPEFFPSFPWPQG